MEIKRNLAIESTAVYKYLNNIVGANFGHHGPPLRQLNSLKLSPPSLHQNFSSNFIFGVARDGIFDECLAKHSSCPLCRASLKLDPSFTEILIQEPFRYLHLALVFLFLTSSRQSVSVKPLEVKTPWEKIGGPSSDHKEDGTDAMNNRCNRKEDRLDTTNVRDNCVALADNGNSGRVKVRVSYLSILQISHLVWI